jgi:hypothetical protein
MSEYIQISGIRGTPYRPNYIQLAAIIGNHTKNVDQMYENDFYTLCQKNSTNNLGLRKKSNIDQNENVFLLSDISLEYLCSDFVRFCLALYKNKQNIHKGELKIIPIKPIPISEELKQYIREFLPDFYDNRTN